MTGWRISFSQFGQLLHWWDDHMCQLDPGDSPLLPPPRVSWAQSMTGLVCHTKEFGWTLTIIMPLYWRLKVVVDTFHGFLKSWKLRIVTILRRRIKLRIHNKPYEFGKWCRKVKAHAIATQLLSDRKGIQICPFWLCLPYLPPGPSHHHLSLEELLMVLPASSLSLLQSRVTCKNGHQVMSTFCLKPFPSNRHCCYVPASFLPTHHPGHPCSRGEPS